MALTFEISPGPPGRFRAWNPETRLWVHGDTLEALRDRCVEAVTNHLLQLTDGLALERRVCVQAEPLTLEGLRAAEDAQTPRHGKVR